MSRWNGDWVVVSVAAAGIFLVAVAASSAGHTPKGEGSSNRPPSAAAPSSDVKDPLPSPTVPKRSIPADEQASAPTSTASSAATSVLATLKVISRTTRPSDYRRDAFGGGWVDVDGNGCNQRDDVLLRDAESGTTRVEHAGACDHDVVAGTWLDPYTRTIHVMTNMRDPVQAQTVQIDHVVPLAEAWASGADQWDFERRVRFANDLDELLAVDGSTNESKGDSDPAAWRPRKAYQCEYADHWIAIKSKWNLGADSSEIRALEEMLSYCD